MPAADRPQHMRILGRSGHLAVLALMVAAVALSAQRAAVDLEALPFAPRTYVSYRTPSPLQVDGKLTEPAWNAAPWCDDFIDIEGPSRAAPRVRTRAKMLWDDKYFYVAA